LVHITIFVYYLAI